MNHSPSSPASASASSDDAPLRAVAEVEQSLRELNAILTNAPVAIGFSRERKIVRYNQRFGELFGYVGNTGIGRPTLELYPDAEAYAETSKLAFPLLSAGHPFVSDMRLKRQDGSTFWAHAIAYLIDPQQPELGTIWIIDDHSARKAAAEALEKSRLEQQAILDNAWVGIVFTRQRIIERCNPCVEEMFGYAPGELIGLAGQDIYPSIEAYHALGARATPILAAGGVFETEQEFRRKDGSPLVGHVRARAIDPTRTEAGTIWIVEDVTAERAAQTQLRQTMIELEAIMANASVAILFTRERVITRHNARCAELFGYGPDAMVGLAGRALYPSQDIYDRIGAEAGPLLSAGRPFRTEVPMLRRDGGRFWAQMIGYVLDPADTGRGTVWIIDDQSERKQAEEALRNALLENEAILKNALIGIAMAENGRIVRCNRKMEEIFGADPDSLSGICVRDLYAETADWLEVRGVVAADFAAGRVHISEHELVRRDGRLFWASLSGRPFDPRLPRGPSVWLLDDISARREAEAAVRRSHELLELRVRERTAELGNANRLLKAEIAEREQAERRIEHMAYHDDLTGLPNRARMVERLHEALRPAKAGGQGGAVLFIDLDRFKQINDTLGHQVGDHLLVAVARRLERAVRPGDTVARPGGDEFVVILPRLRDAEEARALAQRLIEALAHGFTIQRRQLRISPSIGICLFPEDGKDVDTLLRNADIAMYRAKAAGRNTWQVFTAQLNQAVAQRFEIESLLHHALPRNELRLFFQPIMDIASRSLASMEVLLRWQQPRLGAVEPGRFIPVLEDTGGIVAVGAWVVQAACRQLREWRDAGLPVVPLAVNLSARQFAHPGLLPTLRAALDDSGIAPDLLELEITESGIIENPAQTLELMAQIRAMGLRLAIDDFGTGYSSLAYLKRFPVSKLKIDRAFVKDSQRNVEDGAIIAAIIALADSLDLKVVAEGVELAEQLRLLAGKGCDYAQGYLFARPAPEAEARTWLGAAPWPQDLA